MIICPPPTPGVLDPSWPVPHPGFGWTALYRNGVKMWEDIDGYWYDEYETTPFTVGALTEWCPVSRGVGWMLEVYGPMVIERYRLRRGSWVLTEQERGFA